MKQGNGAEQAGGAFNPFANPFLLLGVSQSAAAREIEAAYWKAVGEARVPKADLEAARQILADPAQRLDAELLNIFDADGASGILHKGEPASALAGIAASLPALPRSNLLAHIYAVTPADTAGLKAFVEAQSAVRADAVCEAINKARRTAGFEPTNELEVTQAIARLLRRQSEAVVGGMTDLAAGARVIAAVDTRPSRAATDLAPFLTVLMHAYANAALPELNKRRGALFEALDRLKEAPKNSRRAWAAIEALSEWAEIWRLLHDANPGLNGHAARAREVQGELLKFRVWAGICNERELAQRIEEAAAALLRPLADELGAASTPGPIQALRTTGGHGDADAGSGIADVASDRGRAVQIRPQADRAMGADGRRPRHPIGAVVSGLADVVSSSRSMLHSARTRGSSELASGVRNSAVHHPGRKILGWGACAVAGVALAFFVHSRVARQPSAPPANVAAMKQVAAAAPTPAPAPPVAATSAAPPAPAESAAAPDSPQPAPASAPAQTVAAIPTAPPPPAAAAVPAMPGAAGSGAASSPRESGVPPPGGPAREAGDSAIDLLLTPEATKVQRRLSELGFFAGSPNGIWGPQSRGALRQFKSANALPQDDEWDRETQERLFSREARASAGGGAGGSDAQESTEARYQPPAGATLNPLNQPDAVHVQKRLMELGYFPGPASGLWGRSSRNALRDMKVVNGLPADDSWNAETEHTLDAPEALKAANSFVGGWASDPADCRAPSAGGAPVRISTREAKTEGGSCLFGHTQRTTNGWRVAAVCTGKGENGKGEKWKSDVNLSVAGDDLTWTSEKGTMSLHRCRG